MALHHGTLKYRIVGEKLAEIKGNAVALRNPTAVEDATSFRFSRLGPVGPDADHVKINLLVKLALSMTDGSATHQDGHIPAGYTYLGQFIDHDLVLNDGAFTPGLSVDMETLRSLRSPLLDLDCLYGLGPDHPASAEIYDPDGVHLSRVGHVEGPRLDGFDLPRRGVGPTKRKQREALIADARNDENLAVAQVHNAFIRFHNRVVDQEVPAGLPRLERFRKAREIVTRHYHAMIRDDFLPRIIRPSMLKKLWGPKRRFFEVDPIDAPTMPIEFSVAAFRMGHSMIRKIYAWNKNFGGPFENKTGAFGDGHLMRLFRFSGTSGNLSPDLSGAAPGSLEDMNQLRDPNSGDFLVLPQVWVADWRRLVEFKQPELQVPVQKFNFARRLDTLLVDPLAALPQGSFSADMDTLPENVMIPNLAFRNLVRGRMLSLATGQQMATRFGVEALGESDLLDGKGGATLDRLTATEKKKLADETPLWFYVLREAEINDGFMGEVGATIIAETFHRAMEASEFSLLAVPGWQPTLGSDGQFTFADLLHYAFEGKVENLNPVGD